MDFEYSDRTKALLEKLHKFMDEVIYPAEPVYEEQMEKAKDRWQLPPVIEECKAEAKKRGLWNMFLPADRETGDTHGTMGLSNLEYAPICEVLGRSSIASEAVNCSAPDTGNMEVFARYGRQGAQGEVAEAAAQRRDPLLLRHDRAGGRLVRRAQRRVPHREPTATTMSSTAASGGRRAWATRAARSSS